MLMWEEAAIKDDVIEYDIAFNIIYIMRTNVVLVSGPPGMANRRREKPSNNQLPDGLAQYALSIIRERYTDFGPTLACENLAELHDVHLSKEIVRSLMVKAGRWLPRKQRAPKIQ